MTHPAIVTLLLGVIAVSLVVLTVALLRAARALRRVLARVFLMLPACEQAVDEAHRTLGEARQLLTRTNHATRHMESVIHKTCNAAADVAEQVALWQGRAQSWWGEHLVRQGVRPRPRRAQHG